MYEGPYNQTTTAEYLEGKVFQEEPQEAQSDTGDGALGVFQNKQVNPEQDTWNKLREDPFLEIKRQEKKTGDFIRNNPVKMAAIKRKLLEMEKLRKDQKRKKKGKKEKKGEKRKREDGDERHEHREAKKPALAPEDDIKDVKAEMAKDRRKQREERDKLTREKREERKKKEGRRCAR